jgi:hypothetical protein
MLIPSSDGLEACQQNIADMKHLDEEASRLNVKVGTQKQQCKALQPWARCVLPQPKDLGASESGQKTIV